jgi:hypothetical protein
MKPSVLIALVVLSLVGIASAATLFIKSDAPSNVDAAKPTIEIKWGEGS